MTYSLFKHGSQIIFCALCKGKGQHQCRLHTVSPFRQSPSRESKLIKRKKAHSAELCEEGTQRRTKVDDHFDMFSVEHQEKASGKDVDEYQI